jgi:hypothetical protein
VRLIASCASEPPNVSHSPYPAAMPAFAVAGIVVIEMNTPISAADFAVVSESIPTMPAQKATKNAKKSGFEMVFASAWSCASKRRDDHAADGAQQADGERPCRAHREGCAALQRGDAEPGDRAEVGADDHRADDEDRGVEEQPDGGDERREHHEDDEAERQLGALRRALRDLLPHDGVGGRSLRDALGAVHPVRQLGLDRLHRDRAVVVHVELAQVGEQDARVLARDVAEHEIALRAPRRVAQHDDVARRLRALEHLEDAVGARLRRDDPQVEHVAN